MDLPVCWHLDEVSVCAYLYCIDPCCDTACKIIGKEPEEE